MHGYSSFGRSPLLNFSTSSYKMGKKRDNCQVDSSSLRSFLAPCFFLLTSNLRENGTIELFLFSDAASSNLIL
nr:hypothetical protein Iba_chr13eCG6690 [Ipomoea batatas]